MEYVNLVMENPSKDKTKSSSSSDPGAARLGNFINYYEFNPAEKRTSLIPRDLIQRHATRAREAGAAFIGLDIGCNTGVR